MGVLPRISRIRLRIELHVNVRHIRRVVVLVTPARVAAFRHGGVLTHNFAEVAVNQITLFRDLPQCGNLLCRFTSTQYIPWDQRQAEEEEKEGEEEEEERDGAITHARQHALAQSLKAHTVPHLILGQIQHAAAFHDTGRIVFPEWTLCIEIYLEQFKKRGVLPDHSKESQDSVAGQALCGWGVG
jgi:hypothetical protein